MSDLQALPPLPLATRLRCWAMGARFDSLALIVAPLIVGVAYAYAAAGRIAIVPVAAAVAASLFIQIATNIANDAADGESGVDGPGRVGPQGATGAGLIDPASMRWGAVLATLCAAATGLVCVAYGGWPILFVGLASIAAGWAYSYGPAPVSRTPLGEAFVAAFFGMVATAGIAYLAAGVFDGAVVALGLAIGLPAAAVLGANNHRDRAQDAVAGRRTFAILAGERASILSYGAQVVGASIVGALALAPSTRLGAILVLATGVVGVALTRDLARTPVGGGGTRCLGNTAKFQMALAALIALLLAMRP